MNKKSTKLSAFFNPRTLLGLFIIFAGIALALFALGKASAQRAPSGHSGNSQPIVQAQYRGVMQVVKFDISPPLRNMKPLPWKNCTLRENEEQGPIPAGPVGPVVADPVVQRVLGKIGIPAPIITFDGNSNLCGCSPPDPNGAVGPNHVVTMSNLHFQIFNKTGTSLFGPAANNTLWSGFGGGCQTQNSGDPVVLYDQLADRWLLTQFTSSPPYLECVALSQTNDPTGAYYRWSIATGNGNNFPDYPKAGMWPDAYYFSTREFAGGSTFVGVGAYAFNRAQALVGNPNPQVISFLAPPNPAYVVGDGLLPSDLDGMTPPPAGSPNYFVGSEDNNGGYGAPQDALTLWKFHADFNTPANSSFVLTNTLPTAPFNSILTLCGGSRACIPQPGTTNRIDHLGYRQRPLFRLAYRNFGNHESLVTNQSVSAGTGPNGEVSGIRWWELRSPNSSPVIFQEGTYAPGLTDGIHRWMGSIAMNSLGDIALGYSASNSTNPSTFPSVFYTGRHAGDPPGQMTLGEGSIKDGTGSQTGSNRWGDYTAMVVDPSDDTTFWYINQYVPTTSSIGWRLRIGAFNLGGGCTPSWSAGPNLPTVLVRAVGVYFPADGNFYTMGGRTADTAGSDFQHVLRYSPVSNTWTQMGVTLPDNTMNNMACGVLTVSGTPYIYCVGGSAAGQTTATARVFFYNPATDTATALTGADNWPGDAAGTILPGGFAVTGNKLYILGGFNINVSSTNQIYSFDPTAGVGAKWTLAPVTTPVGIMYAPTTAVGGIVYVGGASDYSGGTVIDTTTSFTFNPVTNTIGSILAIPRATGETRALNFNGNMYVMGGGRVAPNPSSEVDICCWSTGAPFTTPRRNFPTDTNGTDHIWLAGGYASDGITPLSSMEIFQCASPVTVSSAVSRKIHGGAGTFDVALPLTGTDGVECRTSGGTNDYTMVVTFSANVTVTGSPQAQLTMGTGCVGSGGVCTGNVSVSGNTVTVPLTNIANAQNINVRINGVNGAADAPATDFNIPMGVLVGDTNANRTVNAADIAQTKARLGQTVDGTNYRSDVNANGSINAADVAIIKGHSGTSIP
jgi:hypothetical protein